MGLTKISRTAICWFKTCERCKVILDYTWPHKVQQLCLKSADINRNLHSSLHCIQVAKINNDTKQLIKWGNHKQLSIISVYIFQILDMKLGFIILLHLHLDRN